ncbi:hypothetical protein CN611_04130 [Bacillus wiedmannii]|uniref:Uncharacterized protein n=1 Tax=Bacillus wiedmannii TaxID=1890302 RepID=A0A2A8FB55_9BACI|nr:hypothetical protein CN672_09350 [Bacillus wiedmannii]PEM58726.1 hypothetical protein CN611_04130 [Bacillus wiedmannii]PEN03558.1 hypothetical protein CN621_01440 [Bacillus wiedmannii]PEO40521.1 hypothetical protein CN555_03190 [Bacillus wiedmannii]PFY94434.1 hypothetical protein COL57_23925 [Bacillus wiedmannii]
MYYPLFSQYTLTTIFHLEIYDCTNTVWVEKIGGTNSASSYRSDSSFHFSVADTHILCYLFTLYYIFQ